MLRGIDITGGSTLIKLTDQQWADIVQILSSYAADLEHMDGINPEYVEFITEIINEIGDQQNESDFDIEFEMDWDDTAEPDS